MGFNHPTPIQEKVIPHLISSGQDLIASAQTGTGKTAAFGLPVLSTTKINDSSVQTTYFMSYDRVMYANCK